MRTLLELQVHIQALFNKVPPEASAGETREPGGSSAIYPARYHEGGKNRDRPE